MQSTTLGPSLTVHVEAALETWLGTGRCDGETCIDKKNSLYKNFELDADGNIGFLGTNSHYAKPSEPSFVIEGVLHPTSIERISPQ